MSTTELATIEKHLASPNKRVRLKALKLLLRHPDATPLQLAQALCSPDNRNGEFMQVFELGSAMRESWTRLSGATDREVYQYLWDLYRADPAANVHSVVNVLRHLGTPQALEVAKQMEPTVPEGVRYFSSFLQALTSRAKAAG